MTLLLSIVGSATPGESSTITLHSTVECSAEELAAGCRVELENLGDEAALDLRTEISLAGAETVASRIDSLAPGGQATARAELDRPAGAGRHPVVVRLHYRDENGYPFSALGHAQLVVGDVDPPGVEGVLEPAVLAGSRELRWRLTNREPDTLRLSATLLLPRELSSPEEARRLTLAPGQSVEGSHRVSVSSALAGSVYRVYLLVDYERDGRRQSLFLPADVRIAASRHAAGLYRRTVLIWVALLAAAGTAVQGFGRWRRAGAPPIWSS